MATAVLKQLFRSRALDDFPGPFAERARHTAEELRELWDRASRDAAENRRLDELHAARDEYRELLAGHVRLLSEYLALAELHHRALGANPAWADELRPAVRDLQGLHDGLFPRWQTLRDLHGILIEKFSLPAETLRERAAKSPPPQAWFEETADPFSAISCLCDRLEAGPTTRLA